MIEKRTKEKLTLLTLMTLAINEMLREDKIWSKEKFLDTTRQYGKNYPETVFDDIESIFYEAIAPCADEWCHQSKVDHCLRKEGRLDSIAHFIDDPTHPADLILRENAGDIKDDRMHERVFAEKPRSLSLVLGRDLRLTSLLPKTTLKIPMPPCKPPKVDEFFSSDILLMGTTKTGE